MAKKENLEEKLEKLEKIVADMESGDIELDKSIEMFESGIKLYKSCQEILDKAQKKISILTEDLQEKDYVQESD